MMASCRASAQVLVLDCCFSGAFARGLVPKADTAGALADSLRPVGPGSGRVVLAASGAVQYSFEAPDPVAARQRSVYTAALVEGLRTGAADANRDGWVTASEWHQFATARVREQTASQGPRMWSFDVEDDPLIGRVASAQPVTPPVGAARTDASTAAPEPRASAATEVPAAPARPSSTSRGGRLVPIAVALGVVAVAGVVLARRGTDDAPVTTHGHRSHHCPHHCSHHCSGGRRGRVDRVRGGPDNRG